MHRDFYISKLNPVLQTRIPPVKFILKTKAQMYEFKKCTKEILSTKSNKNLYYQVLVLIFKY